MIDTGLSDHVTVSTKISKLGTDGNQYRRGYEIRELMDKCIGEEVFFMMYQGRFPSQEELLDLQN